MRRSVLVAATILLATVAGAFATPPAGGISQARGVKFVLDYRGTITGSWRQASRADVARCLGSESWGTLASSVRPGSRPYTLVVSTFGRRAELSWSRHGNDSGTVTTTRTAEGWMLRSSRGVCSQVPQ